MTIQRHRLFVAGMYCNACVVLTESELAEIAGVREVRASLAERSVEVAGDFGGRSTSEVAEYLSPALARHGYALSTDRPAHSVAWREFVWATPAATIFVLLFVALQRAGVVNWVSVREVGLGTAFVLGIIASVSTCMAIIGGLVLSISATFAKAGDGTRPQVLFHVGRLAAFFLLGGVIGAAGSMFRLGPTGLLTVGIVVGLLMVVLGLNLLDVVPWARRLQPKLPAVLGRSVYRLQRANHVLTPVALGIATFVLPCGFTQSMQLYALSTGSFVEGAMVMFAFALGTLPVLAALSFGAASFRNPRYAGVFFKSAGLVVMFFGAWNIWNSLAVVGVVPPISIA